MHPCIAWDGCTLASPVSMASANATAGVTVDLFIQPSHGKYLIFPRSEWGTMEAVCVAARPGNYQQFLDFLQSCPLQDVIDFYKRAATYGLLGKKLHLDMMAVTEIYVITLSVKSTRCTVTMADRKVPVALGKNSVAARTLMLAGAPADLACTTELLDMEDVHAEIRVNSVCNRPQPGVTYIPPREPEPWHRRSVLCHKRRELVQFLEALKTRTSV